MLGSLGWEELIVILVILALAFGASRVSALGGALGRGIREFREEASKSESSPPSQQSIPTSTANADSDVERQ